MKLSLEELPRSVAGYLLVVVALLLALAVMSFHPLDPSWLSAGADVVHNWLGQVGAWVAGLLVSLFGPWALFFPWALGRVGWRWLQGERLAGAKISASCLLATVVFGAGLAAGLVETVPYRGGFLSLGGAVGQLTFRGLRESLGEVGAFLVCLAGLVAGATFGLRRHPVAVARGLREAWHRRWAELRARLARGRQNRQRRKLEKKLLLRQLAKSAAPKPLMVWRPVPGPAPDLGPSYAAETFGRSEARKTRSKVAPASPVLPEVVEETVPPQHQQVFDFLLETPPSALPELSLLEPPAESLLPKASELEHMRQLVEEKFLEFKVEGRVEGVIPGPVITTFEFQPAPGVKYAQVVRLEEDLALKLGGGSGALGTHPRQGYGGRGGAQSPAANHRAPGNSRILAFCQRALTSHFGLGEGHSRYPYGG